MTAIALWTGPAGVPIPASAHAPSEIVPYAGALTAAEQARVVQALGADLHDMGTEFVWKRAMTRLRQTVAGLGMSFVGEMLGRADIDASSSPDTALTDYDTIRLSEQLGIVSATGALKLRHAFEMLAHYAAGGADDEFSLAEAVIILRACVQYALGEQQLQVAGDFSRFRDDLLTRTLTSDDPQVERLAGSPPFFLSTVIRTLLAALRAEKGVRLEHCSENLNVVLPAVWERLPEQDRLSVGTAYAEVTAAGKTSAIAGLKRALLRVAGFDYVPESLRSNTYRRAAQAVIDAHFGWGNFDAEIAPTKHLASLGTTIPKPAVPECVRAFLLVYVGNRFGHSFYAAPTAQDQLAALTPTVWDYFVSKVLPSDTELLQALTDANPAGRFIVLLPMLRLPADGSHWPSGPARLIAAARDKNALRVQDAARTMIRQFKEERKAA